MGPSAILPKTYEGVSRKLAKWATEVDFLKKMEDHFDGEYRPPEVLSKEELKALIESLALNDDLAREMDDDIEEVSREVLLSLVMQGESELLYPEDDDDGDDGGLEEYEPVSDSHKEGLAINKNLGRQRLFFPWVKKGEEKVSS